MVNRAGLFELDMWGMLWWVQIINLPRFGLDVFQHPKNNLSLYIVLDHPVWVQWRMLSPFRYSKRYDKAYFSQNMFVQLLVVVENSCLCIQFCWNCEGKARQFKALKRSSYVMFYVAQMVNLVQYCFIICLNMSDLLEMLWNS